jgi:hypothetical protein
MITYNFPPTSRYYQLDLTSLTTADGRVITYLERRFVPPPDRFALLQLHVVTEGERLDTIAAAHMDDSTAFWRIADANTAMRPGELTETPGRALRITLPEGLPGTPNA